MCTLAKLPSTPVVGFSSLPFLPAFFRRYQGSYLVVVVKDSYKLVELEAMSHILLICVCLWLVHYFTRIFLDF